jgi:hypothetical protein
MCVSSRTRKLVVTIAIHDNRMEDHVNLSRWRVNLDMSRSLARNVYETAGVLVLVYATSIFHDFAPSLDLLSFWNCVSVAALLHEPLQHVS